MFCGLLNAVLFSDIYATIQNYIDEIEEIKAKCEAYERFIKYKNEEIEKRKEFEKTAEFRTQRLEVIAGIRKEIEYPE